MRMRLRAWIPALAVLLIAPAARAGVSLTSDYVTGNGYRGWDGKGRMDFGSRGQWALTTGYAWAHAMSGTESLSKQGTLGFEHNPDDNWSFRGTATLWKDVISGVKYGGPSWGFTYLVTKDSPSERPVRAFRKLDERQPGEPVDNEETLPPDEAFGISYDNDLFFYQAPETSTPRTVTVKKKLVLVPPSPTAINVTSWHPQIQLEKPLFKQVVVPSITLGHYFYSKNPIVIEARAGAPRFSASSGSLGALAGGFFKNNGQAALDFVLPYHSHLHASLGAEQSATDNTWAVTQELSAKTTMADRVGLSAKWDRTLQTGTTTDQYTVGATLYF